MDSKSGCVCALWKFMKRETIFSAITHNLLSNCSLISEALSNERSKLRFSTLRIALPIWCSVMPNKLSSRVPTFWSSGISKSLLGFRVLWKRTFLKSTLQKNLRTWVRLRRPRCGESGWAARVRSHSRNKCLWVLWIFLLPKIGTNVNPLSMVLRQCWAENGDSLCLRIRGNTDKTVRLHSRCSPKTSQSTVTKLSLFQRWKWSKRCSLHRNHTSFWVFAELLWNFDDFDLRVALGVETDHRVYVLRWLFRFLRSEMHIAHSQLRAQRIDSFFVDSLELFEVRNERFGFLHCGPFVEWSDQLHFRFAHRLQQLLFVLQNATDVFGLRISFGDQLAQSFCFWNRESFFSPDGQNSLGLSHALLHWGDVT